MHRLTWAALLAAVSGVVWAQSGDALPPSLSGRWTFVGPRGALIDSFSIVFDSDRLPGKVTGKLTWRGFNCGAKDEPIAATWDGATLKFEATTRPNVNAQRMNGQCSADPSRFVLKRTADARSFEGEVHSGDVVVTLTASP